MAVSGILMALCESSVLHKTMSIHTFMSMQVYVVVFIIILTYLCGLIGTTLFDTHTVPAATISAGIEDQMNDDRGWEPAYVFSYGKYLPLVAHILLFF